MKTATSIVLTAVVAGLAAGWIVATLQAPVVTLTTRDSQALEPRVTELEAELERWRADRRESATSRGGVEEAASDALHSPREELRDPRARLERSTDSVEVETDRRFREEVAAIVDDRLERIEEERQLQIAERQSKEASRWARTFAREEAARIGKRLALDERQVDRLAEALELHHVANAPHFAVVKDEARDIGERLGAIDAIRGQRSVLEESAREILDWRQFYEYQAMREEQPDKVGVWIDELEAQLVESDDPAASPGG